MAKKIRPVSPLEPFLILKYFLMVFSIAYRVAGKRFILSALGVTTAIMVVVIACDSTG